MKPLYRIGDIVRIKSNLMELEELYNANDELREDDSFKMYYREKGNIIPDPDGKLEWDFTYSYRYLLGGVFKIVKIFEPDDNNASYHRSLITYEVAATEETKFDFVINDNIETNFFEFEIQGIYKPYKLESIVERFSEANITDLKNLEDTI